MQAVQQEIAQALKVQPPFADAAALEAEVARRVAFIKDCLANARLKTLVLGISGGRLADRRPARPARHQRTARRNR